MGTGVSVRVFPPHQRQQPQHQQPQQTTPTPSSPTVQPRSPIPIRSNIFSAPSRPPPQAPGSTTATPSPSEPTTDTTPTTTTPAKTTPTTATPLPSHNSGASVQSASQRFQLPQALPRAGSTETFRPGLSTRDPTAAGRGIGRGGGVSGGGSVGVPGASGGGGSAPGSPSSTHTPGGLSRSDWYEKSSEGLPNTTTTTNGGTEESEQNGTGDEANVSRGRSGNGEGPPPGLRQKAVFRSMRVAPAPPGSVQSGDIQVPLVFHSIFSWVLLPHFGLFRYKAMIPEEEVALGT